MERTGTGVVVRVDTWEVSGFGRGGPAVSDAELWSVGVVVGGRSPSSRGRRTIDRGRRWGSGFAAMWVGIPPWDAMVGTEDDDGRGTNVWRCLGLWFDRP